MFQAKSSAWFFINVCLNHRKLYHLQKEEKKTTTIQNKKKRDRTRKLINISYCFGTLGVMVLVDMMIVHPSRKSNQYFEFDRISTFNTLAFSIPNCTLVFETIQIS